jgi:hypothetical protein
MAYCFDAKGCGRAGEMSPVVNVWRTRCTGVLGSVFGFGNTDIGYWVLGIGWRSMCMGGDWDTKVHRYVTSLFFGTFCCNFPGFWHRITYPLVESASSFISCHFNLHHVCLQMPFYWTCLASNVCLCMHTPSSFSSNKQASDLSLNPQMINPFRRRLRLLLRLPHLSSLRPLRPLIRRPLHEARPIRLRRSARRAYPPTSTHAIHRRRKRKEKELFAENERVCSERNIQEMAYLALPSTRRYRMSRPGSGAWISATWNLGRRRGRRRG